MKLSLIKKRCLERGEFRILDTDRGGQWIGNGCAFWPVEGVRMDADAVPALFDLSAKKLESVVIDEYDAPDWRWDMWFRDADEALIEEGMVYWNGELFRVLRGGFGGVIIPESALDPMKPGDDAQFYARGAGDSLLVACCAGMRCGALVAPMSARTAVLIMEAVDRIARVKLMERTEG